MNRPIVEIKALEVGYKSAGRSNTLLSPIDLEISFGSFIALVGPNGAGKSTLLRTLSGLQSPLSGEVVIKGKKLLHLTLSERSKLLSIVLTEHPDDFYLKAEEVVASGRYPYTNFWARLSKFDQQIIAQSMDSCGVAHLKHRRLISLSDGERQKVMIAKALAQDTPLIILDEPAAFLDYPSKIELMHLLKDLTVHSGKTILFSSHDLDLVLRSADRVWLISPNKPLLEGIPEELVLKGSINDYFDKTKLSFDISLGHFVSASEPNKTVLVQIEDPIMRKWVSNALLRKGFKADGDSHANTLEVQTNSGQFIVKSQLGSHFFSNLESMINFLINHK